MFNSWKKQLRKQLLQTIMNDSYAISFKSLQFRFPCLRNHPTPQSVLTALQDRASVSNEVKNATLHALLVTYQSSGASKFDALPLLLLAMWPALEHTFYKLLPLSHHFADLFSEIYWAFIQELEHFNPAKRTKIAINLQWNTEKRVRNAIRLETRYRHFVQVYSAIDPDMEREVGDSSSEQLTEFREWLTELPQGELRTFLWNAVRSQITQPDEYSPGVMKTTLHHLMTRNVIAPEEERLLAGHAVEGHSLAHLAGQLGMKEGTARVKYFRAKTKVRAHIESGSKAVTFCPIDGLY